MTLYEPQQEVEAKPPGCRVWVKGKAIEDLGREGVKVNCGRGETLLERKQVRLPKGRRKGKPDPAQARLRQELDAPAAKPAPLVRRVHVGPLPMVACPKPEGRWESETYRQYVRQVPCASCGTLKQVEAHHHGGDRGISQKAHDTRCVPLCIRCHRGPSGLHATGRLLGMPLLSTKEAIDAYLFDVQVRLMHEFFTAGMGED